MSRHLGTLASWRTELRAGNITPAELVRNVAQAIDKSDTATHAYLSFDTDKAVKQAEQADIHSALAGIPIAIKDNICVYGEPARCASKLLENFIAPYDATAIVKLKASGGIPFGRTNMDEFAMGSTGANSAFGATGNPNNQTHAPGGSSSGSAAAVADGTAIAALGSDTGGSIRQPAAHCGIVGLKPTYGRVSRYGLVAFASSLDQIGTLTQTVEDSGILLQAICGHDPHDSTSSNRECDDFTSGLGRDIKGTRIGIPQEYRTSGNHPRITAALDKAISPLESVCAEILQITLRLSEAVVAAYYIIACAEASSNLSRFDGIRYGERAANPNGLEDLYRRTREAGFGPEVKKRIILGTYVLSSGYYDAYYSRAQKVRALVAEDFRKAYAEVDYILGPTTPAPAPKLHDSAMTPLQTYLADIYTIPANLAGLPGISIPCPVDGDALPVGIQLLGRHFDETGLLTVAHAVEQSLNV